MLTKDGEQIQGTEYILLCGGVGSRLNQSLFPKPLTYILGEQLIYRVLRGLKLSNLTIVCNTHLQYYNFEALVRKYVTINSNIDCLRFWYLPFPTRGSLESIYLYLTRVPLRRSKIVILDNDNIYNLIEYNASLEELQESGLLYIRAHKDNISSQYSFIKKDENSNLIEIKEKVKISNLICVGYYLSDIDSMISVMMKILSTKMSEYYLSELYRYLLEKNLQRDNESVILKTLELDNVIILGTIDDTLFFDKHFGSENDKNDNNKNDNNKNENANKYVVFDIDNTLITNDGLPILEQISFLRKLKSLGWKISLYTARGMKSRCNTSLEDKEMKPIRESIIQSLEKYNIPFDTLHLSKPYGEFYVDDKAFNPYDDSYYSKLGFFNINHEHHKEVSNKDNIIIRTSNSTVMKHTITSNEAEINYYNFIHKTNWSEYFPKLYKSGISYVIPYTRSMELEYIPGPTMSDLFVEGLLSVEMFNNFLDLVDRMHNSDVTDQVIITYDDIKNFYIDKLQRRRIHVLDFVDHDEVYNTLMERLLSYLERSNKNNNTIEISNIIHGDLWFPNIIISKGSFKFIDMRGYIGKKVTIKGDKMYDYAKIYQSLSGMDLILRGGVITSNTNNLLDAFHKRYSNYMFDIRTLSAYTIYCSFFSWSEGSDKKSDVWNIVKQLLH